MNIFPISLFPINLSSLINFFKKESELRAKMRNAHIGELDNKKGRYIAIEVEIWNTGKSVPIVDWFLHIIMPGQTPVNASFFTINEPFKVSGKKTSAVIYPSECLDIKIKEVKVGLKAVKGWLFFYTDLSQQAVLNNRTRLELSCEDSYGNHRVLRSQRIGDWPNDGSLD